MNEKIFKGFKQVTSSAFNTAKEANELSGYLWFVRTEVPEVEGENNVANDEYDIYFGSRQYGHFCEGELSGIKTAIENTNGSIDEIVSTLSALTSAIEANASAISANTESIGNNANAISGLQSALESFLVKNIDSNDKVLNVADGILSSSIELVYENTHIKLYGKGKEVTETDESGNSVTKIVKEELGSIDASAFIKDSVLDDVDVVEVEGEKYLEFKWKVETEGDEPKVDRIKISEFAKLYSAGVALELDENDKFNVKVAANDNFLTVNSNNELIVDDVTTDKTMLKQDITIEGGPLATDAVKAAFTGGVIPAGTDIQSVLKALLCVEIYPSPTANTPTYSVSISAPTITAKNDAGSTVNNNALVEVGSKITFASVTAKAVSSSKTNPSVKKFDHGYSTGTTSADTIVIATGLTTEWDIEQKDGEVYKLTPSIVSGFTGDIPASASSSANTSCQISACTLTVSEGTNTYKVSEDAPKHVGTHDGIPSVYVVSNLGGRDESHKSPAIDAVTSDEPLEKSVASSSSTFTVTGLYPIFTNGVTASTTDATAAAMADLTAHVSGDGTKLALMKSDTSFAVSFAAHTKGVEGYRLYLPGSWTVKTAMAINANTAKFAVDQKNKFVVLKDAEGNTLKVKRTIQGNEVDYTVYEYLATEGANRVKFTVG